MAVYDVIVIGAGPSGYTAGIYMARDTLSVLILAGHAPGGQLLLTSEVENFPGFSKGILGPELMSEMEKQAKRFGCEVVYEQVGKVDFSGEIKKVMVGEKVYESKAVVVSTGGYSKMVGVGEEAFIGRGVSTCAVCDAAFFKGKKTFVVGGGDAAMEDTMALVKFAGEVSVIHRRDEFRASKIMQDRVLKNEKVKVMWNSELVGVEGDANLERIKVRNLLSGEVSEMEAEGLFVAIGHVPATKIFEGVLDLDEKGYLITTMTARMKGLSWKEAEGDIWLGGYPTMTSMEGVFGAGDVVDYRYRQAITAAGMGCQAALDVEKYLSEK